MLQGSACWGSAAGAGGSAAGAGVLLQELGYGCRSWGTAAGAGMLHPELPAGPELRAAHSRRAVAEWRSPASSAVLLWDSRWWDTLHLHSRCSLS